MGRREQAREEARFARGELGVDGQSTAEVQDELEVEKDKAREQFLRGKSYVGREFLTWLLWRSESGEPLATLEDAPVTVLFTDRLVLRGIAGEIVEMIVRGAMSPYSPNVRRALDRGLLIHQARLRMAHGEREYQLTIDAEFLDFRSAKLPALLTEEEEDNGIEERLYFTEQLSALVQLLLEQFLKLRASKRWTPEIVPAMKEWMSEMPPEKQRKRA
jgi:hypothetical protein